MNPETVSVRISKAEREALRARAERDGVSQGTLIRRALRAYGVTPEAEETTTGYDVIKHIVGSVRGGPTDLSTNPRHLAKYGK